MRFLVSGMCALGGFRGGFGLFGGLGFRVWGWWVQNVGLGRLEFGVLAWG